MNEQPQTSAADPLSVEDRARANMYALIGRLFYAAPESNLMAQICEDSGADDEAGESGALSLAWQALQNACRSAFPAVLKQEHETLFIGVGRAEVTPYTSNYVTDSAPDRHLVTLRDQLRMWGLARSDMVFEVEDHISGLCDVMRFLIEEHVPLTEQRGFFEKFVWTGAPPLLEKLKTSPSADFYRHVGALAEAFFRVEQAAFEMDGNSINENSSQLRPSR